MGKFKYTLTMGDNTLVIETNTIVFNDSDRLDVNASVYTRGFIFEVLNGFTLEDKDNMNKISKFIKENQPSKLTIKYDYIDPTTPLSCVLVQNASVGTVSQSLNNTDPTLNNLKLEVIISYALD